MVAASNHGIEGIIGDCGGAMSCATCHVFVDSAFSDLLPPVNDTENQMLDYTAVLREPNSRLSCQIVMSDAIDGITVQIPETQV